MVVALGSGEVFTREGDPGFEDMVGLVVTGEAVGEGLAEEVEGGYEFRSEACLIMAKGAEDDRAGGEAEGLEGSGRAFDPGVEVGLCPLFESQEADGHGIFAGRKGKVRTEVVVGKAGVTTFYKCL